MKVRPILAMSAMACSGVGLFAIAWLAVHGLSPQELGFFFSFLSFGALLQLGDFGLSYATLVMAGKLVGTGKEADLPAFSAFVARWNVVSCLAFVVLVGILGTVTFEQASLLPGVSPVSWQGPWLAYLIGALAFQLGLPGVSLREGGGKAQRMWQLRLVQELLGASGCLVALHLGARLWSLVVYIALRAITVGIWLRFWDPMAPPKGRFSLRRWMNEGWPFQWKIGLSALAGYLIFRAFSPIVLYTKGPIAAGQIGLAVAVMNLLIQVTGAWPMSQTARYTALLAAQRLGEFEAELPHILLRSTVFSFLSVLLTLGALWAARGQGILFAMRLPETLTVMMLLFTAVAHHFVGCYAVFLRANGQEPLVYWSVVGGLVTLAAIWAASQLGSLRSVSITYFLVCLAGVPIGPILFRSQIRKRKQFKEIPR